MGVVALAVVLPDVEAKIGNPLGMPLLPGKRARTQVLADGFLNSFHDGSHVSPDPQRVRPRVIVAFPIDQRAVVNPGRRAAEQLESGSEQTVRFAKAGKRDLVRLPPRKGVLERAQQADGATQPASSDADASPGKTGSLKIPARLADGDSRDIGEMHRPAGNFA